MATQLPADFITFSKQWEGFRSKAYPDPGSRDGTPWTIGYGQTEINGVPVKKGDTITEARASELLQQRHDRLAARILGVVKVPLSPYQLATLVSFADNVGWGNSRTPGFSTSTLLKKLNAGDYNAVPAQLVRWVNNDGAKMQGLVNRRAAEAGLWSKGAFVASAPVDAKPHGEPVVTQETVSWGAGILATLGAVFAGNGPVQWALAVVIVAAFGVGAFLFIKSRVRPT